MYNNYKLINEKVSKLGETIKVGDFIRYADVKNNRFDDKYRGQDIGVVEQIRYYDEHNIHFIVNGTMVESYYVEVVKNSKKEEKEIVITKERNNDKFQEFRRMILENLAVVLKIICGDKFLIHKFDTKDYMDYEPKFVTKEEYAMNMIERDLHEVYNIMTQGYTEVCNGGSIEKIDLTHKYNVCTLVSTETKTKNNTQEIKMKDGKEKMSKFKELNQMTNKHGDIITVGDYVKYTTRTDNWLHKTVRGTDCGTVVGIREYEGGETFVMVDNVRVKNYACIPENLEVKEKKEQEEKEIVITKERSNEKGQEFRKMIRNVRVLEESVEKGLLQGYALESAKQTLDKIDHRTTGVDTWVLENNEGTYGTEIVITKEGHIDLYLCIMEKYASIVSYIRVGNFQPEFGLGDVWLPDGEIKEYQKLGTIINTLNKVYEKYGFYFTADTKNNRRILADARKSYELFKAEEKERKEEEVKDAEHKEEVERLRNKLVEKEQELLSKEVTFDIDGEGKVEEIKDASYADANENYKRRRYQAPEKGNGYNKTYVTMKLDGKKFHDMVICLHGETEHHNLKDAILAQIKVLRKTWVEGDGVPHFKPEKNKEIIEKKYGSKEKLAIVLDAKEMVVRSLGMDNSKEELVKESKKQTLEIVNTDYDNIWTCVLEKSIKKVAFKKEKGLTGKIKIVDLELGRIYFVNSLGEDCTLRMWNYYEVRNGKQLRVEWTMYRHIDGEETEDLGVGITLVNFADVPELSQEKKERMEKLSKISKLAMKFLDMEKEEVAKLLETINEPVEYAENARFLAGFHLETNGIVHREEMGANGETVEQVWDIMKDEVKTYVMNTVEELGIKIEKTKKGINKSEDKQMNTINKNALNNRMVKLGEFLKENRDKDAVENKVLELFPKAMEVEVFEGDNVVYFLVGQDYVGKAPTKKEMKELDFEFGELNRMYGLSVHVTVNSEKITMNANVGVEYTDKYGYSHYTDYVVKEMEIDCNPEPEKTDELEKYIKDHIHEVIDLIIRENHDVGYMYKKTVAVKRNDRYEITSLFEDMWTGKNVYIGNDSNMLMIPNSEKSFLTDIVEKFLCSNIGINETVEKIKEKIKRKFEYSYSKSVTVKEEEEIYVLETPSGVELFWYYKDAYSRMVELVNEMSERFSNNYEVIIEDYSARMETFSWRIIEKNIK